MDLSSTAKAQVVRVEQSQEDARYQVLDSVTGTLAAVKRLVAAYDRVKAERDNFERQLASVVGDNETLRKQANEAKDQRDHFSKALATLTDQMDAVGARCVEAVKIARAQSYHKAPAAPVDTLATDGPNSAEQATTVEAGATAQNGEQALPKSLPVESRPPAVQPAVPSAPRAAPDSATEVFRSAQAFMQYVIQ
jgi:hypothetical protein